MQIHVLVGRVLDRNATAPIQALQWCAVVFMCAAVCGIVDIHVFHSVPELRPAPRRPAPRRGPTQGDAPPAAAAAVGEKRRCLPERAGLT